MADWDEDSFMSQWDEKYVSTNVRSGSRSYDKDFFSTLTDDLTTSEPKLQDVSYCIVVRTSVFQQAILITVRFSKIHRLQHAAQLVVQTLSDGFSTTSPLHLGQ